MNLKPYGAKTYLWLILLVSLLLAGIVLVGYSMNGPAGILKRLGLGTVMTAGIWLGCALIVTYLWNRFPWEEKPVLHLFIEIISIIGYTVLYSFTVYHIALYLELYTPVESIFMEAVFTVILTLLITAIHESVFFYRQWKYNFSRSVRLERDNLEAKYEGLRAQINPHFLFNSLNSLTGMVDDNPQAVGYIANLSDFFRYMLSSRDKELVSVGDEIELLEKYIALQRTRFPGNLDFSLEIPENCFAYAIPPLVLQMLVENSIKHNVISRERPLKVRLFVQGQFLCVENNLQKKTEVASTGQGLRNIRERYSFFTGEEVKVTSGAGMFRVAVPLLEAAL